MSWGTLGGKGERLKVDKGPGMGVKQRAIGEKKKWAGGGGTRGKKWCG